jgi:hypothetical protein
MVKPRLKIIAVLLTVLVLYSTSSYSVAIHKCNNIVFAISFTNNASQSCEMQMPSCKAEMDFCKNSSNANSQLSYFKKACCSNQKITKKSTSIELHKRIKLKKDKAYTPSLFFYSTRYFKPFLKKTTHYFIQYSPPLLTKNISNLYEVFRL